VNELGWLGFSCQNRSPALKSRKDSPMMHPKTGPTMLPVRGRSDTPAVHKSMSSGESLIEVKCFSVSLVKASAKSLQLSAFFNPQRLLFLCFHLIFKLKI
jgi:hypothetical protein